MHKDLPKVAAQLLSAEKILLTCHRGPDGDSVGSLVALASLLREHQKKVVLYNPDLVPRHLKWLPHAKTFVQQLKKKARFDLTIVVDCGDANLLGNAFPEPEVTGTLLVLDHHGSGRPFGDVFVSDPAVSAVGVMVAQLAELMEWPISKDAGQGIYVSIVSDTGGFRYSNTNAEVLRVAAKLVEESGVDPAAMSERMSTDSSPGRYRLLSKILASMEVAVSGKVAFITITPQLLKECGASWDDTDGLINYARSLRGVECGVLICPSKYGGTRVSMRTRGENFDAGKICYEFGGGGHKGAAGCTLPGSMEEARVTIEERLAAVLAK
ncbi:MAG: DHH family phosphoesterase [Kofleriaceae bacterium]|nr:DHH family phosphoesterase [Kofleriaceae bacterium]